MTTTMIPKTRLHLESPVAQLYHLIWTRNDRDGGSMAFQTKTRAMKMAMSFHPMTSWYILYPASGGPEVVHETH
jgi:hypothetical protein